MREVLRRNPVYQGLLVQELLNVVAIRSSQVQSLLRRDVAFCIRTLETNRMTQHLYRPFGINIKPSCDDWPLIQAPNDPTGYGIPSGKYTGREAGYQLQRSRLRLSGSNHRGSSSRRCPRLVSSLRAGS